MKICAAYGSRLDCASCQSTCAQGGSFEIPRKEPEDQTEGQSNQKHGSSEEPLHEDSIGHKARDEHSTQKSEDLPSDKASEKEPGDHSPSQRPSHNSAHDVAEPPGGQADGDIASQTFGPGADVHNAAHDAAEPPGGQAGVVIGGQDSGSQADADDVAHDSTEPPSEQADVVIGPTPVDKTMVGPLTLDEYRARWGNIGEHATVQVVVQGLLFDSLSARQFVPIRSLFVQHLSQATGVKPSDVIDMNGNAPGVSLAGQGRAGSRNLVVNCGMLLPFGQVKADISNALHKVATKDAIAEALSSLPGIEQTISGGVVQPSSIEIEVDNDRQDALLQSDEDINGMLDASEFKQASDRYMDQPLTLQESEEVFRSLDLNHDGQLSDAEFYAVSQLRAKSEPTVNIT